MEALGIYYRSLLPLIRVYKMIVLIAKKQVIHHAEGHVKRNGYMNGSYSEQEVAQLNEWNPEQIRTRGLKLLEFMEKRWEIKLGNEEQKLLLLGVNL